jgi:hypothetical protein
MAAANLGMAQDPHVSAAVCFTDECSIGEFLIFKRFFSENPFSLA